MTYYSKKRGVKKSFKNGKVKSRLSFKNKNKKNRKNKKTRTRRRNRRLNGGAGNLDDILKTVYTEDIFNKDKRYAHIISLILVLYLFKCFNIEENKQTILDKESIKKCLGKKTQGGGANHISKPITFQINNGSIKVNREVVNDLRIKLKTTSDTQLETLETYLNSIVPEVEPPASGATPSTRLQSFETIKADFATLKAEYERDRALAELREVKEKLARTQVDSVDLLSRHVVDHIVEKNLKAIDDISKTRPALFEFLQSEGMQDTINNLVDINALLE